MWPTFIYQTCPPKSSCFLSFFFSRVNFLERLITLHIPVFNKTFNSYFLSLLQPSVMAIFGFRRLMKNLFCFCTTGWDEEKAPPPTPVPEDKLRRLRSSQWDVEGVAACAHLSPCGQPYGMVVRTRREAAAGVCNIIYPQ